MLLIAANAMLRFKNRDVDTLLPLPGQREDPAFIVVSRCGRLPEKLLVWFSEMTTQREAELRQRDLLHYTGSLMANVKTLVRDQSTYDQLAAFILNDCAGLFIAGIGPESKAAIGMGLSSGASLRNTLPTSRTYLRACKIRRIPYFHLFFNNYPVRCFR